MFCYNIITSLYRPRTGLRNIVRKEEDMDYKEWSREYYRDAKKLLKTIRKYEKQLADSGRQNLEELNSTISSYRYIYYDLINTAKLLESRGEKTNAA